MCRRVELFFAHGGIIPSTSVRVMSGPQRLHGPMGDRAAFRMFLGYSLVLENVGRYLAPKLEDLEGQLVVSHFQNEHMTKWYNMFDSVWWKTVTSQQPIASRNVSFTAEVGTSVSTSVVGKTSDWIWLLWTPLQVHIPYPKLVQNRILSVYSNWVFYGMGTRTMINKHINHINTFWICGGIQDKVQDFAQRLLSLGVRLSELLCENWISGIVPWRKTCNGS